jgi:hypothetical protein
MSLSRRTREFSGPWAELREILVEGRAQKRQAGAGVRGDFLRGS